MNNKLYIAVLFIAALYILKVPSVVSFINGILIVVFNAWNYIVDVISNVRERHPWLWIAIFFALWYTMIPPKAYSNAKS